MRNDIFSLKKNKQNFKDYFAVLVRNIHILCIQAYVCICIHVFIYMYIYITYIYISLIIGGYNLIKKYKLYLCVLFMVFVCVIKHTQEA